MAVIIRHGPNGSYKSASAVWFNLVPELRKGRICITNVEGIYPLHEIEKRLGEKFPDSARLIRISSLTSKGLKLWRRWFHWMPVTSFVLMDEIQDIYPEGTWKEADLDLKPIETYEAYLPDGFLSLFYEALDGYKPDRFDTGDTDDTGEQMFDESGRIRYPTTLNGAFKRHRKFNWDIVCCTPDISDVSKKIRGCAELALSQANKDSFFLFKRRPRIYEHNPKTNGIPSARDNVYRIKVPLAAFTLYKSTQTGAHTQSGWSKGPFSSGAFLVYLFILFGVIIWISTDYIGTDKAAPDATAQTPAPLSGSSAVVPVQGTQGAGRGVAVSVPQSPAPDQAVFVAPMGATEIYVTGHSLDTSGSGVVLLSLTTKSGEFHTNNDELFSMGYGVRFIRYCQAELLHIDTGATRRIFCQPSRYEAPKDGSGSDEGRVRLDGITIATAATGGDDSKERPN
jgi:zona occludens toxin